MELLTFSQFFAPNLDRKKSKEYLINLLDYQNTIFLKDRSVGATSYSIVYIAWFLSYNTCYKNKIIYISNNNINSYLIDKIYNILNKYYKTIGIYDQSKKIKKINKNSLEMINGNKFEILSINSELENHIRGYKVSTIIFDDAFYSRGNIKNFEKIYKLFNYCSFDKIVINQTPEKYKWKIISMLYCNFNFNLIKLKDGLFSNFIFDFYNDD